MPRPIAAAEWPALLRAGMTVYAPGVGGESPLLVEALRAAPHAAAGVRFTGVWLPGINRIDYAGLHPEARATAFFLTPDIRETFAAGRVDYLPLAYSAIFDHLATREPVDLALLHVSPPDADGLCSLGLANDFTPAVLDRATTRIAHVNPRIPRTPGAATVRFDDLDVVVEAAAPLAGQGVASDATFGTIGRHIAGLMPEAATVQVGVGRVQAVLPALAGARSLRIHAGIVQDTVLELVAAEALADDPGAVTTGVAWGSDALYDFCAADPRVLFRPVGQTHGQATLAAIDRFVAINTVIEIDLLGQANAEMVGGRQISSAGGITDFLRGARASNGGLAIVALAASAKGETVSRIVPALESGTAISVPRGDIDIVVTEHGVADLRGRSIDDRAAALIGVAAPAFRDALAAAWADRRRRM